MLGILSKIYGSVVKLRNKKFDDTKNIYKSSVPVFSVGNISAGGTGKTPFVEMLARLILKFGHKPAIVGLGYKRKSKGEIIVCDGKKVLSEASEAGDEMLLLAAKLRIPVIAHDDKTEGVKSAEKNFDIDSIIIDDGFQHRKLHRDLDIVLIDKDTLNDTALLPKGRLREPLSAASRADVICFMDRAEANEELNNAIGDNQLIITAGGKSLRPVDLFSHRRLHGKLLHEIKDGIISVSGIAKPERFEKMLKNHNYNIIENHRFPDHHNYSKSDIEKIIQKADGKRKTYVATTEKDATKLRQFRDLFFEKKVYVCVYPFSIKVFQNRSELNRRIKYTFKEFYKTNDRK